MKKKKIESHCCLAFSTSTPPNPPALAASSLRTTLYQSPLFVTLPVNSVSIGGQVRRRKAMAQSFKTLLVASVEGVIVEVWWGLVEKDEPRVYNWQGYLDLVALAKRCGLKVRPVMAFHLSDPSV